VPVPAEWVGRAGPVNFIVTDQAHNRTTIVMDLSQ
jgi:hypothetical protein